jgi:GNAT superfamily N-acetyltransferase
MIEKFKKEEKQMQVEKRFVKHTNADELEIKLLDIENLADVVKVMRRCAYDVTENEVEVILKYGMSYGAYVDRILVGVSLGWPASFDEDNLVITTKEPNSIYNEDPAVLLSYEGRGIRRILLKKKEEAAKSIGFQYSIAYLYEDLPKGEVSQYIREAGSQLEKLYLSEEYKFHKTKKGVLAIKKL